MAEYLKIPRGSSHDFNHRYNDLIIKRFICAIGKTTAKGYRGTTEYSRGKNYLANECQVDKNVIKKLHSPKISLSGSLIDNNYSYLLRLHKTDASKVVGKLLDLIPRDRDGFFKLVNNIVPNKYTYESNEFDVLFEETMYWLHNSTISGNHLQAVNKHNDHVLKDLDSLINQFEALRGQQK